MNSKILEGFGAAALFIGTCVVIYLYGRIQYKDGYAKGSQRTIKVGETYYVIQKDEDSKGTEAE